MLIEVQEHLEGDEDGRAFIVSYSLTWPAAILAGKRRSEAPAALAAETRLVARGKG
jgi:hypothetical protein